MKSINFKNKLELIKAIVTNPKVIIPTALVAGGVLIGGQQLKAQELLGIRDLSITPLIEPVGSSVHTNTFMLQNLDDKTQDFLMSSLEYRYGGEVKGKKLGGTYNVGVEVGSNNFMINKKLVSDKLYEQVHLAMGLSKVFNTPLTINLGYSQKLGNYFFDGAQLTGNVKSGKSGTGGVLNIKDGKLLSYEGIQEVTFGKKYTGALRFYNARDSSMKNAYYNLYGIVDMSAEKYVFVPYGSIASTRANLKKGILDYNLGIFFKPLKGKVGGKAYAYAEVGVNKTGKWSLFTRLNYRLTTPDVKASKDAVIKAALEKKQKVKEKFERLTQKHENKVTAKKSLFKPRNQLSPRVR